MPTVTLIRCRQCGHCAPASAFPTGEFRCPDCDWREILPPDSSRIIVRDAGGSGAGRTPASPAPGATAAAAPPEMVTALDDELPDTALGDDDLGHELGNGMDHFDAAPHDEALATPSWGGAAPAPDTGDVGEMTHEELVRRCERIFDRLGCTARRDDAGDCDLELTRGGEVVLVECRSATADQPVTVRDCQRLVGALVGRGAAQGILVTNGGFDAATRRYTREVASVRLDLIDGAELRTTIDALDCPVFTKWTGG